MKGVLIAMAIILVVPGVLTGGFGVSIGTSLSIVAAILVILAIMSTINRAK